MFSRNRNFVHYCLSDKGFRKRLGRRLDGAANHVEQCANMSFISDKLRMAYFTGEFRSFPLDLFDAAIDGDAQFIYEILEDAAQEGLPICLKDVREIVRGRVYEHLWVRVLSLFTGPESVPLNEIEKKARASIAAERGLLAGAVTSELVLRSQEYRSHIVEPWSDFVIPHLPQRLGCGFDLYDGELLSMKASTLGPCVEDKDFASALRELEDGGSEWGELRHLLTPNLYASSVLCVRVQAHCSQLRFEELCLQASVCARSTLLSLMLTNQINIHWASCAVTFDNNHVDASASNVYREVRRLQDLALADWKRMCEIVLTDPDDGKSLRARIHRAAGFLLVADEKSTPIDIRFLACVSAVEAILSRGKEGISEQISSSVAYLIETEPSLRSSAIREFKKLYGVRSKIAHGELIKVRQQQFVDVRKVAAAVVIAALDRERFWEKMGSEPERGSDFAEQVYEAGLAGRVLDGIEPGRRLADAVWPDRKKIPNT